MGSQLVTVKQAASILGVSENTIYNLVHADRIPYFRIGLGRGTIRIDRVDVERLKTPHPSRETVGLRHLGEAT